MLRHIVCHSDVMINVALNIILSIRGFEPYARLRILTQDTNDFLQLVRINSLQLVQSIHPFKAIGEIRPLFQILLQHGTAKHDGKAIRSHVKHFSPSQI
jgi:hypothetical protein